MSPSSILDILRQDYQRFPIDQTYEIYAQDVYFQDPLNQFRGVDKYKKTISFIQSWFIQPRMEVLELHQIDHVIHSQWRLSWQAPLPWRPHMLITGRSELTLNPAGLIASHIDFWDCSRLDVLKQLLPHANA
jgi:hypothetical protein